MCATECWLNVIQIFVYNENSNKMCFNKSFGAGRLAQAKTQVKKEIDLI